MSYGKRDAVVDGQAAAYMRRHGLPDRFFFIQRQRWREGWLTAAEFLAELEQAVANPALLKREWVRTRGRGWRPVEDVIVREDLL